MTVSKIRREAARTALARSAKYDPATMQIDRDGYVSAKTDADKTFSPRDTTRYLVDHIGNIVTLDGQIQDGY